MAYIEPLQLETWIVNVFSGNFEVFTGIALIVIAGMGAYFRMPTLALFFMMGLFFAMFSQYMGGANLFVLFGIIGALVAGYVFSRVFSR